MTMPLCFVDTETTGLHVDKQLWEVAIIRRDFDNQPTSPVQGFRETRYGAFVPVDLSNADLFGLNVGRFYERHPLGRFLSGREQQAVLGNKPEGEIAQEIARFTHGARFIGGAPSFDAEVLGKFLRKHGLLPTWHHRLVDTHDLLTGYLLGLQREGAIDLPADIYSLSKTEKEEAARLNIGPLTADFAHTAMGDAQHEADIWDAIMS